ncbi:unnamed protein product, partial [Macrosiphum euphorbiae]
QPPAESSHEPSDAESMGLVDLFDLQPADHVYREIPLPPADPSTSVDLVLVPDNVVEVPEVPPPSDDRTTRDETANRSHGEFRPGRTGTGYRRQGPRCRRRKPGDGSRGRPRCQI